jgi:hypothetical protein
VKRILILSAIIMAMQNFVMAQEQTGLHFDNYTASSGMLLNPAATFASPNRWEINVVSAGAFAQNNYLYFNHQSILSLEHAYMKSSIADPDVLYSNTNQIKVYTLGFVQGPSAFVKMGRINGGIFTDARSIVSGHSDIMEAPLRLDTFAYDEIYHVPAFNTSMMNWSEVGFNLGAELLHTHKS